MENRIIDFIDGRLGEEEKALLEKELAGNPEAFRLYEQFREIMSAMDKSEKLEPRAGLKLEFEKMLHDEMAKQKTSKSVFFQPVIYRAAAGIALVMVGITIGYWINRNQEQEARLAEIERKLEETKHGMLVMMDNQQSASQRLQGVSVALTITKADDEIVTALVKTMNEDPNSNVRLAALEALSKFQQDPQVRAALIQSLAIQKDPVVQIALIQLMVKMKEKGVVKDLEKIIDNVETIKAVKDEAYSGLLKLS